MFPGRTIFVPRQDDNVSSQGRYLFPDGTIRSGWEISHRSRCGFPGRTILGGQLTSRAAPQDPSWEPHAQLFLPGRDDIGIKA